MIFLSRCNRVSFPCIEKIQVYLIDLINIKNTEVLHAKECLDRETFNRTNRYVFIEDQHKRTIIYAILRLYLERFLGQTASNIKILRNSCGKPYLEGLPIHFSISHTKKYAILAFHPYYPIGVDVEQIRNISNILEISNLFMHHDEKSHMLNCTDTIDYFFSLWCAKEAFLKAKEICFEQLSKWSLSIKPTSGIYKYFSSNQYDTHLYGKTIESHKIAVCIDKKNENSSKVGV